MMIEGKDYIGVGVGALVFNSEGKVFLAQRGPMAKNEVGKWEFPGGGVDFGETMVAAIQREFREEYGMEIAVEALLSVSDHILPEEEQHWVSPSFIGRHVGGIPHIIEVQKCTAIGWFDLANLPQPLSMITQDNLLHYLARQGSTNP